MTRVRPLPSLAALALALWIAPFAPAGGQRATPCDQRTADVRADSGWRAWRRGAVAEAAAQFRGAVARCPSRPGAWVGLGYVALRSDSLGLALARFDSALVLDAKLVDAHQGRGLVLWRRGDLRGARGAFEAVQRLEPGEATSAGYLARIPEFPDAAALPSRPRPTTLQLVSKTVPRGFQVRDSAGSWRPLWIKAINLGAALPGRHPSEFPPNDGTYEGWFQAIADAGGNTVRVYTIHPPHFYRALAKYNRTHADRPLWLIHGVWTELPPGPLEEDYDDPAWNAAFTNEMRQVVDLLHGQAAIEPRPGHAAGQYDTDVSPWTLGYIIGREWEPYSVEAYAERHPTMTRFDGRYVRVRDGNAVEVWLARFVDGMIDYEMRRWNTQRPIAYTNWPTLDPLHHPTESTKAEEQAWLRRRRTALAESVREFDNDAIALDATTWTATAEYPAGLFASYHAYPYYPDFLVLDPGYRAARSPLGPSAYFGYLRDLVAHHGEMPVVISEYGVPSSRGNAHLQPQGWHHGGHDEVAQGVIDARLTREIHAAGAAGAGLFALIDEWFKKNWMVIDFESPLERNRLWLNPLDPEQNYGLIAMRPGVRDSAIRIDGRREDWRGRGLLYARSASAPAVAPALRLDSLHVLWDEGYVYLRLDVGTIDWSKGRYLIGIDTFDPARGDHRLPYTGSDPRVGLEFVLDLHGPEGSHLLTDSPYRLYQYVRIDGAIPPDSQMVWNRPFRTERNADGRYDSTFVHSNRRRIGRDGTLFPAEGYDRSLLRFARQDQSSLADWYADAATGVIEVRIPWGMLQVLDPSSRTVLFGRPQATDPEGTPTAGFRFVVESLDPTRPEGGADRLPRDGTAFAMPTLWQWPTWESPRWYAERKPAMRAMREAFDAIP